MTEIVRFGATVDADNTYPFINLPDPVNAQDADTKAARNAAIGTALAPYATDAELASAIATLATNAGLVAAIAQLKSELLNGAGAAYDTLKELQDLIVSDQSAFAALVTVVSGKAPLSHSHTLAEVTGLVAALADKASVAALAAVSAALATHVADLANPHAVTKAQVGLSAVTNDAQLPKAGGVTTGAVLSTPVVLTDAATVAVNASLGNMFNLTIGGNRTLGNPTGVPAAGQSQVIQVAVKQDGAGGRTLAYGSDYAFSTDLPSPTLSTAPNALDILAFRYRQASGKWIFIGKNFGFGNV